MRAAVRVSGSTDHGKIPAIERGLAGTVAIFLLLTVPLDGAAAQERSGPETRTPEAASDSSGNPPVRPGELLPPSAPVRTPAEWEEAAAVLLAWEGHQPLLRQIVSAASTETEVIVLARDTLAARSDLVAHGIGLESVSFEQVPLNSVWVRDYGPWSVYSDDVGSLRLIDWIYDRPRPADDEVPLTISRRYGVPIHRMTIPPFDLVQSGGNFMTDGLGTAVSTRLVVEENWSGDYTRSVKSESVVDSLMRRFMGVDRYIKLEELPHESRSHIDMYMKLLDEETLLVGEFPPGVADHLYIEQNLKELLAHHASVFGTPYRVVRVPMPPSRDGAYPPHTSYRTYTNAVFVNRSILVPTYGSPYDSTALRVIAEALPGYRVIGIDSESIIRNFGAIHCVTKLVHSVDPLLISHQRKRSGSAVGPYRISARIQHRSGIKEATVWWRSDRHEAWRPVAMRPVDAVRRVWSATIPGLLREGGLSYYIEATARSGKRQVRPLTAPEGYWTFDIALADPRH